MTVGWVAFMDDLALDQQYLERIMSSDSSCLSQSDRPPLFYHKIHFSVRKRVRYGQALFVCGDIPQLGCWNPSRAFRLKCTDDDVWSGALLLRQTIPQVCQFKYIVAEWERPGEGAVVWEAGEHNRRADLDSQRSLTYCHDRWNMDKISFNILVPRSAKDQEERYYVTGEIRELGEWKERRLMKRIIKRQRVHQEGIYDKLQADPKTSVFAYSFYAFRGRSAFSYSYLRTGRALAAERTPKRSLDLRQQWASQPDRLGVFHPKGEVFVLDRCSVGELACSQVTGGILVGSHLRTRGDLQRLKAEGVTSVLALQSERDLKKQGLSPHYLQLLCEESGLKYRCYAIEDMNPEDFILKGEGGVRLMHELLREGRLYVYCSAGIYRSPQLVALYLALHQEYSLDDAINLVRRNHPYAKPSYKTLHAALRLAKLKKFLRKMPI